ncbi:MAG TPA: cytochrome c oxidase subunit II [Candidatus Acidoferrales bacterium]|nr:cytochrome c oxidase subunit II [Candidatus Acidoferrales bacterium]
MAASLAIFLILFVGITLYYFFAKKWWYPPAINDFGREIDAQFARTFIITGIVFVASQLGLAWVVWRYRSNGGRAQHFEGNNTFEGLWTVATIVLFVGLGVFGRTAWAQLHFNSDQPGAMEIEVTGKQFNWFFRYPGADGKFGRLEPKLVTESNPVGLDDKDPAGQDDVVTATLGVPVGREIKLLERSLDVTHGFFVRELRLKQDALPGMVIPVHFHVDTDKVGEYEISCTQLCGSNHHRMRATLKVMTQADFDKWLANEKANQ